MAPDTRDNPARPEIIPERLERLIHHQVNSIRRSLDIAPLAWDSLLADVARGHSREMAERNTFSHLGRGGTTPTDRATSAGYECVKENGDYRYLGVAENIYMTYIYGSRRTYHTGSGVRRKYDWKTMDEIAEQIVDGWMNSPGHRRNIVEARHDREGIGIFRAGDQLYITQNLC
ncbi:MAG: CAP domain-containing protein [Bacteroidota bacterium]